MNKLRNKTDLIIGFLGSCFALSTLFLWVPTDIDTGVIDVWRRTMRIGDAMLPTFAALGILISSLVLGARAFLKAPTESFRQIDAQFVFWAVTFVALSLALMLGTGPILAWVWYGDETPYRLLLATAPWKYFGFILGGSAMTFCFISLASHKLNWRIASIALISTVVIAALYDLPFDNLLLPPNGDF